MPSLSPVHRRLIIADEGSDWHHPLGTSALRLPTPAQGLSLAIVKAARMRVTRISLRSEAHRSNCGKPIRSIEPLRGLYGQIRSRDFAQAA
jgi:hypothetical protein